MGHIETINKMAHLLKICGKPSTTEEEIDKVVQDLIKMGVYKK